MIQLYGEGEEGLGFRYYLHEAIRDAREYLNRLPDRSYVVFATESGEFFASVSRNEETGHADFVILLD